MIYKVGDCLSFSHSNTDSYLLIENITDKFYIAKWYKKYNHLATSSLLHLGIKTVENSSIEKIKPLRIKNTKLARKLHKNNIFSSTNLYLYLKSEN